MAIQEINAAGGVLGKNQPGRGGWRFGLADVRPRRRRS